MMGRAMTLLAVGVGLAGAACTNAKTVAANLSNAALAARLPLVVACWEKEFEDAGFRGGYVATVDFEIDSSSKIHRSSVTSLEPLEGTPSRETEAFRTCIQDALDRSALPTKANEEGPGFSTTFGIAVKNYRIDFVDASAERMKLASTRQANVLIGPRTNRCDGLYAYDPPRDASTLYNEIAMAQARAEKLRTQDPNVHAQELQKAYDTQLELASRLSRDLEDPALPEANKTRLIEALAAAELEAKKTGMSIGCTPPRRSK
jgi:hypothetical protein